MLGWKNTKDTVLELTGARQVGKTAVYASYYNTVFLNNPDTLIIIDEIQESKEVYEMVKLREMEVYYASRNES